MKEIPLTDGTHVVVKEDIEKGTTTGEDIYKFYLQGNDSPRAGFGECTVHTFTSAFDRFREVGIPEYVKEKIPVGVPFMNVTVFYPNGADASNEQLMRSGAGTTMYEKMLARATALGAEYIVTGTASPSAQQFWKKHGFETVDTYWFIKKI